MGKSTNSMPQTDSIQELARFWDTHDLTDFEDELEEVTEPVFEREAVVKAKAKGVGSAELIR
jgi:hypothetical protein